LIEPSAFIGVTIATPAPVKIVFFIIILLDRYDQ
jgi:hypothetical protein